MRNKLFFLLALAIFSSLSYADKGFEEFKSILKDKCICFIEDSGTSSSEILKIKTCFNAVKDKANIPNTVCTKAQMTAWFEKKSGDKNLSKNEKKAIVEEAFKPFDLSRFDNSTDVVVPFADNVVDTGVLDLTLIKTTKTVGQESLQNNVIVRDFCACKITTPIKDTNDWTSFRDCYSKAKESLPNSLKGMEASFDKETTKKTRSLPGVCKAPELRQWYRENKQYANEELDKLCSVLKENKQINKCENAAQKDIKLAKQCLDLFPPDKDANLAYQAESRLLCFDSESEKFADTFNSCKTSFKDAAVSSEQMVKCLKGKIDSGEASCIAKLQSYKVQDSKPFISSGDKLCHSGGKESEVEQLFLCYENSKTAVSKDPKKLQKAIDDKFFACVTESPILAKYNLKSFSQNLADQFRCVAGCEAQCAERFEKPEIYSQCVVGRVGQEAAKAILAELAKEGGMIGALASVGMDVTSCIQPKTLGTNEVLDNPTSFCKLLDPGLGSPPISSGVRESCISAIGSFCSTHKNNPSMYQACGSTVVSCLKTNTTGAGLNACFATTFNKDVAKEYSVNRGTTDSTFRQQTCLAGAMSGGVNAIVSAICSDEKKYPTSEAKEKCLKDLRVVNEFGKAGATVANCMSSGPTPKEREEYDKLVKIVNPSKSEKEQLNIYKSKQADRGRCLADKLGDQAMDGLADALKLSESERALLGAGKNLAVSAMDCKRITDSEKQKTCWTNAGFNTATSLLGSQIKDPTQRAIALGVMTGARGMVDCNGKKDKELATCMLQASFKSMGQMPGVVGEAAKLANAVNSVFKDFKTCNGERECVMQNMAKVLPGNAGIYSNFAVRGYTLLKQKNTCKVPSKYLLKASGLVSLIGDTATQILHQTQTNKLKKEFGSLVNEQKARSQSGLFENVAGFVNKNNQNRDNEKIEEATEGSPDVQLKSLQFLTRNEEHVLEKNLIGRPFLYVSSTLTAAGTVLSITETFAESAAMATKVVGGDALAPWLQCEQLKKFLKAFPSSLPVGMFLSDNSEFMQEIRSLGRTRDYYHVNKDFNLASSQDSLAQFMDLQRFKDGELESMSLYEYDSLKMMNESLENNRDVNEILAYVVSNEFSLIGESRAFNLGSVENIGVSMVSGLFPGKDGFKPGDPGAYAEGIVYQFIKTVLDKSCQDKAKQGGTCQYTGKAALELAAKTAAKALLITKKEITEKIMTSSVGRILIAGQHAYNVSKVIVENEKMIKDQRNRVHNARQQETDMLNSNKSPRRDKSSFNWKRQFDRYILSNAYAAKKPDSPTNMSMCVGQDMVIDFKCSCQKTGCFDVFPIKDKDYQKNMEAVIKRDTDSYKSSSSIIAQTASTTNALMSGQIGTEDVDIEEMVKNTEKLNTLGKNLLKKLNANRAKEKKVIIDVEKFIEHQDKILYASLGPDLLKTVEEMAGPKGSYEPSDMMNSLPDLAATDKTEPAPSETAATETPEESAPETNVLTQAEIDKAQLTAKLDEKYNENMNSEFEVEDINNAKTNSIFDQISNRYKKKQIELEE